MRKRNGRRNHYCSWMKRKYKVRGAFEMEKKDRRGDFNRICVVVLEHML